jgi:translation initiation factor 2B subunit (eIF-2B alpha/beta/delta family)
MQFNVKVEKAVEPVKEAALKIRTMEIRTAKIARFAAETLKKFAESSEANFDEKMEKAAEILINTRPTAVSLYNAVNYVMRYDGESDEEKRQNVIARAEEFIKWVETAHEKIGEIGAETYKFSPKTLSGELVVIEERDIEEIAPQEILNLRGIRIRNPAFDATPRDYIDVIITEIGAIPPEMAYLVIRERLGYTIFETGEGELNLAHL